MGQEFDSETDSQAYQLPAPPWEYSLPVFARQTFPEQLRVRKTDTAESQTDTSIKPSDFGGRLCLVAANTQNLETRLGQQKSSFENLPFGNCTSERSQTLGDSIIIQR